MDTAQETEKDAFLAAPLVLNGNDLESKAETESDDNTSPKREKWVRRIDFLFACVGFSVGLGNVWRFPYLCYKNGGGAFLLPYFICVVLGGIPTFYLEVSIGQFMNCGGIRAWDICPLFKGIGYATTIIIFTMNTYYNVILTWAFYFLFASFTSVLPWSTCNNDWNSCNCRSVYKNDGNVSEILRPECYQPNSSIVLRTNSSRRADAVDEFWDRKVLAISSGIEEPGMVKWDLALNLLLAWIVVYFCIWKGIKSSGKVMYFTATAPYALMTILLIRGATLDGALDGITYYMKPDFSKIGELEVWVDAGSQIFFSYSIGLGTLIALGSFNDFKHNSMRDCVIFAAINSGTSILAGFVIFSVLGFMASEQGVPISEVASSGPGLAFIAYPKALAQLPLSPLWAVLFFFMVILLGLDSQFVGVEGFITAITDLYPRFFQRKWRREIFIALVCLMSFIVALSMVTEGGMYVFQLFDFYFTSRNMVFISFAECVAISYVYGMNRFEDNLEMMLGYRFKVPVFKVAWTFVTPVFVFVTFVLGSVSYSELTYDRHYQYPKWAIGIGWTMSLVAILVIPLTMVAKMATARGTICERFQTLIRPRLHHMRQLRSSDNPADFAPDCDFAPDIVLNEKPGVE